MSFTGTGVGAFAYDCGGGDPAEGSFRLTTGSLFVPVILSAAGRSNSLFTSELTLTNRGDEEVKLDYTYTAHRGGGSGKTSDVLAPGMQKIETDALTYLRGLGMPIPETGNRIGTLRVEVRLGSEVEAVVRTTTVVPEGRAGLAYLGVAEEEGFEEAVYLCGLRQNSRDRSNVAFQNMGAPEEGAITVRTTVYSGEAADATARVLKDVTLEPGGFHQYSGLLGVLGGSGPRLRQGGEGGGESLLLRLRGDQRPGELGRVVHLSGSGEFTGGHGGADPAGDRGDERVHQRADGDELLGGGRGGLISSLWPKESRRTTRRPPSA